VSPCCRRPSGIGCAAPQSRGKGGKAVVRLCGVEMLCEFALRDVGDEADMRPACLDRAATIERTEIATIPVAAEQGRERTFGSPQVVENGGEFFRKPERRRSVAGCSSRRS
jgi:hypothetical protein